jgi:DNA repair protein RadC
MAHTTDSHLIVTEKHLNDKRSMTNPVPAQERLYNVRPIKSATKIHNKDEAYNRLLKNWDKDVMDWVKEYKTIVLNRSDRPIYEVSFEAIGKVNNDHIIKLFEIIKNLPNAFKIIIGQNSPEKSVLPDQEDRHLAEQFRTFGEQNDMPVVQQLIMSSNSLYAFDQNELTRRITFDAVIT